MRVTFLVLYILGCAPYLCHKKKNIMAKSRLTPDYIEWVMSLNANQALREIHKVNEESKELSRQQNAARQAMVKLESEGKKGSKEWQNLKKSVKEYGDQIKSNNEKMKLLDERLDTNQKSAEQLRKKLKDLRREFGNTSKAIDPQRYRELKREIDETQNAFLRASGATRGPGFTVEVEDDDNGFLHWHRSAIGGNCAEWL